MKKASIKKLGIILLTFINDEIAIKANMRLDIKKALGEAMVIGTVGSMAKASRSKAA